MSDRHLAAQHLMAVTEEEIQRIILDIHDGPVQNLFAALSQLTLLRTRLHDMQPKTGECVVLLNRITALLETSLADMRDLLGTFRSPQFTNSRLAEIVENIVVQHESVIPGMVALEINPPLPTAVSLPVKIAICRILQEALSNVRRHAGVENASVKLWAEKGFLFLEVSDQGRGFELPPLNEPQTAGERGYIGLRGMRERAALMGGKLTVQSRIGTGTCVRVELPIYEK